MTTLNETLFSTIVHDFHNGGVKSSYGLDAYTRKEILAFLIRSKGCNCINCLWGISHRLLGLNASKCQPPMLDLFL